MRDFAAKTDRPFSVRYNAYTQSIEVLDTKVIIMKFVLLITWALKRALYQSLQEKVVRFAKTIRDDMKTLTTVLETL